MSEGTDIGFKLKLIAESLDKTANKRLMSDGLTLAQSRVLTFLGFRGGMASQKALEEHLAISHAAVAGILSRLEEKELIRREPDRKDARANTVHLLPKAAGLLDRIRSSQMALEKRITAGLSEGEVQLLSGFLSTILENVR